MPFYGAHQAGIATPAQDYLSFAAFDLTSEAVEDLRGILQQWTVAAASLAAGQPYQPAFQEPDQPPIDTGEAVGLDPSQLTITVGFGPSLFGSSRHDRFGLAHLKPSMLQPLPPFQGESLDPNSSGGDLCVQACANDPQVAFHVIHLFSRIASSAASLRWSQLGFGRTSSTSHAQTKRTIIDHRANSIGLLLADLERRRWLCFRVLAPAHGYTAATAAVSRSPMARASRSQLRSARFRLDRKGIQKRHGRCEGGPAHRKEGFG